MSSVSMANRMLGNDVQRQDQLRPGLPSIAPYRMPDSAELPAPRVAWRADRKRAALLIHDMQRYFARPFGTRHDALDTAIANMRRLRLDCVRLGIPVLYSVQPGGQTPEQRGLLGDFWGPGMATGPDEEILDKLRPGGADTVVRKSRYSAFFDSALQETLRGAGRDQLMVCGVYAHVGCLMTCCDAFTRGTQAFLVADAVADFSLVDHRWALEWAAGHCARVVSTATLLSGLGPQSRAHEQRRGRR